MDPRGQGERELRSVGEPDEETIARKRSRRVSFAETTAVHFFDRDEDYETPQDTRPGSEEGGADIETVGCRDDLSDSDDSRELRRMEEDQEDDDEDEGEQERFVRDIDSSPGSAVGSMTSNDDDNFFGPVSTSFIRAVSLSEAEMSDGNNHDITLDSTAFSLHFHNIAPLEDRTANSARSIGTPIEEAVPDDTSSLLVPRGFKKPFIHSNLSSADHSGSLDNSNNMSLVDDKSRKYDYGKLSPSLEKLLMEVDKSMQPKSPNTSAKVVVTPKSPNASAKVVVTPKSPNTHSKVELTGAISCEASEEKGEHGTDIDRDGGLNAIDDCPPATHLLNSTGKDTKMSYRLNGNSPKGSLQMGTSISKNTKGIIMITQKENHENAHEAASDIVAISQKIDMLSPLHKSAEVVVTPKSPNTSSKVVVSPKSPNTYSKVELTGAISSEASEAKGEHETGIDKDGGLNATDDCPPATHLLDSPGKDTKMSYRLNGNSTKGSLQMGTSISKNTKGTIMITQKENHENAHEAASDIVAVSQKIDMLSPLHKNSRSHLLFPSADVNTALCEGQLSGNKNSSILLPQPDQSVSSLVMENDHNQNLEAEVGTSTPQNSPKLFQTSFLGSVSSLYAKRQTLFLDHAVTPQSNQINPSTKEQLPSSLELELRRHGERISAIKNQISGFRVDNLQPGVSSKGHVALNLEGKFVKEVDNSNASSTPVLVINLKENSTQENGAHGHSAEFKDLRFQGPERVTESTQIEQDTENLLTFNNLTERESNSETHVLSQSKKTINFNDNSKCSSTPGELDKFGRYSLQESYIVEDDLVGKKRRIKQDSVTYECHIDKISRTGHSSKRSNELVVSTPVIHPNHHLEIVDKHLDIHGQQMRKHLSAILSKVFEVAKLFSPSIQKLSLQELVVLEEILGDLQISRKYQKISALMKNNDNLNDLHQKRVNEVRFLHAKLLYEQVKMQIKHAKLDKLRNKFQVTQSGLQECHDLKSRISVLYLESIRAVQHMENHDNPVSITFSCQNQEENGSTSSRKQELKLLEQKVDQLFKSLLVCCKTKVNIDIDGIIKVANEHLEMRKHISIIQKHLRIWEFTNILKRDNQHDIVLNYCNSLFQRFTINPGQHSSIVVNNSLNEANIEKTFHGINAYKAFDFVFGDQSVSRIGSSKFFQEKTLETSLLMGTLLNVLDEITIARLEILNLVFSTFNHSHNGQLELQLCFINFKSGRKVTLNIDMSELKCSIYPSEPSELKYKICETETTLPSALTQRLMPALKRMHGKHLVILRICRSISQLVQNSVS